MDENSELLLYIYENASMGVNSMTNLIKIINGKSNKIKKIVEGQLKGYEKFEKDSKKLLDKYKITPKDKSLMQDISTSIMMRYEMLKDNTDSKVADMLTKGFTMGNLDISKIIDRYEKDAEKDILDLAKKLLEFGKKNIELLKPFI